MAASYWESTQRLNWTFTKQKLDQMQSKMQESEKALVDRYPLPEKRLINIFLMSQLRKLGSKLNNVRQQALATAQIYIKRYYLFVEIRRTNPYLVVAAALYIACKMEECPQHIRLVAMEAHAQWPDLVPTEIPKLGECEFAIISELSSQLIVHHPYRSLIEIQPRLSLDAEETAHAWQVVNDHYLTDLPLLYAPHIIAITATIMSVVLRPSQGSLHGQAQSSGVAKMLELISGSEDSIFNKSPKFQKTVVWLAESSVDLPQVVDSIQEIISLYELWDQYDEKTTRELVGKFVRERGLNR